MPNRDEITVTGPCPRCSSDCCYTHVVYADCGEVRVSRGASCSRCRYREERDRRAVPADVAALFYERDGRWGLTLVGSGVSAQD